MDRIMAFYGKSYYQLYRIIFFLYFSIPVVPVLNSPSSSCNSSSSSSTILIPGDVKLSLLVPLCRNNFAKYSPLNAYIEGAAWTVKRINALNLTHPFEIGLQKFEVCNIYDYHKAIFEMYALHKESRSVGAITFQQMTEEVKSFSAILNITTKTVDKFWIQLVKASVRVLEFLEWKGTVTVIADNEDALKEFNKQSRREWLCVKEAIVWSNKSNNKPFWRDLDGFILIFGSSYTIEDILRHLQGRILTKFLVVPLDGFNIKDLPEDTFLIEEPRATTSSNLYSSDSPTLEKRVWSPLLLDISSIILYFVRLFLDEICRDALSFTECSQNNSRNRMLWPSNKYPFSVMDVIETLEMKDIKEEFRYDVYYNRKTNNSLLEKIFSYSTFEGTIVDVESDFLLRSNFSYFSSPSTTCEVTLIKQCLQNCVNFRDKVVQNSVVKSHLFGNIVLRSESWLFGFISIAILGVILAFAILIFFLISMFKRIVFEGNPTITVLLLLSAICIYCSIAPFAVAGGDEYLQNSICLSRTFGVSLSYALAFSLLLSRSIVLATISKEIGYMSHASGPIQSFLCLFIFAVQCALSLQYLNKCQALFDGLHFLYSLSYNVILLILLLCVSPLIFQSQRNYKEGKYFTAASTSIAAVWLCWILGYIFLDQEWKDPMICLGLVGTASILIGTILIPRTYLMTVSATRHRITSTLPALQGSCSVMDIYKANTQPIYDSVNITAINSTNRRDRLESPLDDKYFLPETPETNYEEGRIQSPTDTEKVTRF